MLFSFTPNLQTYYHFKQDFQKVDQGIEGKWLIHGTKRHQDNQLQSGNVNMTQRSPKETCSIQYSRRMSRGGNTQGDVRWQNQNYLGKESVKCSSKK